VTQLTGGQLLIKTLLANQVDSVFAIPGVQLDWAFDALSEAKEHIQLYVPRHEQTTTYMADGYARVRGKPGVAMVVPGPGMLNAGAGLATAVSAHSPLLFLVGQIHSTALGAGHGLLHEIKDQTAVMQALTKYNQCVRSSADIPTAVNEAISTMLGAPSGPVGVEFPHDLLEQKVATSTKISAAQPQQLPPPDPKLVAQIGQVLNQAQFPVIYAGGGVIASGASQALRAVAKKLQIPVVMSDNGLGALSARDPGLFLV